MVYSIFLIISWIIHGLYVFFSTFRSHLGEVGIYIFDHIRSYMVLSGTPITYTVRQGLLEVKFLYTFPNDVAISLPSIQLGIYLKILVHFNTLG